MTEFPPPLNIDRIKRIKKAKSKKYVFDALTELLKKGATEITANEIFDALIAREKLGDTSIGNGIAVPRAYLDIKKPVAALLILDNGINLKAADRVDTNIFLAILIPQGKPNYLNNINKELITNKRYRKKSLDKVIQRDKPEAILKFFKTLFKINDIQYEKN